MAVSLIPYPKSVSGTEMINYLHEQNNKKEQTVLEMNQMKIERKENRKQRQIDVSYKKTVITERK